ncbi:hypothetical protein YC2023_037735 [Brassica napus]
MIFGVTANGAIHACSLGQWASSRFNGGCVTKPVVQTFHGYLNHNLYQSFGIDDTNLAGKVKDFTQKLWPDHGIKRVRFEISGSMHGFSKQLPKLDVMVRRMITESFGIEKYIEEHLNSTNYLLRMISIRC